MPPALPALCGETHVSVGVTGTDFQVTARYESTFASVYILLKPFCQFSTRTVGGRVILWGLWLNVLVFNFLLELKRVLKHSLLGFFAYLYTNALTHYFALPLLEWGYLFMTC